MQTKTLFLLAAVAFVGCDCNRGNGLKTSFGELVIVWQDTELVRHADRDATYDFGYALAGDTRQAVIIAKNNGPGPLTLTELTKVEGDDVSIVPLAANPSAAFAVEFGQQKSLLASEEAAFVVTFSPKSGRSNYLAKLKLVADGTAAEANSASITLKARGDEGSCAIPRVLDLGRVPVGESLAVPFVFKNPTEQDTEATIGEFSTGDAAAFGFGPQTASGKVPVAAKGETTVRFTFAPTEQRAYETQLTLAGPGPSCEAVTVTVKGLGVEDVLTWTPSTVKFGLVQPGYEKVMEVTFTNTASAPIELSNIVPSSVQDFTHLVAANADDTKLTIPGGGVPTVMRLGCSPAMLGNRNGTLSFDTGFKRVPKGTLQLECAGGGPKIRVTPRPNIAFGQVPFFQGNPTPVTRRISVQNVGVAPAMADVSFNLILGKVDLTTGATGQAPLFEVNPTGTDTQPGEFSVAIASTYNSRVGVPPTAGQNEVALVISLAPQTSGAKSAEILIHSNDGAEPTVALTVTATVQILPPCNYRVSPQIANFGIVPAGTTKDLPITITNMGTGRGDSCYLSNFALAPNTDAAYSFVGTPPMEKELRPQESWQLVVRVRPTTTPSTLVTLSGAVTFDVTNPTMPQGRVDLRTSVGPSCLAATPDPLDFGTVRTVPPPGMRCSSPNKTITVYNTCSSSIIVRGVSMAAGAGLTAGAPACPGSAPCPEFFIAQAPNIPGTGLTLAQGSMPLSMQVRYSPLDVGTDSGAIAIDVVQSGQQVQYLVALQGRGDSGGRQTDSFQQDRQPRADILLVVDDSCSMSDKQTNLANNFTSFIQYAVTAGVDYQIGLVTTDTATNGQLRVTGAGGRFLTHTTPNVQTHFSNLVRVGISGSGFEQPLAQATLALTPPNIAGANAGFVRQDANLAVVVVSDAEDQSNQPVSYYENLLINVKGFNRLSNFTFSTIGPFLTSAPSGCLYDGGGAATRYSSLITRTGGVREEICNANWSAALQGLGRTAFGFRTQFFLTNTPDTSGGQTINVLIDGQPAPPSAYTYDSASNSVRFLPNTTPQPGQTLSVEYATTCF